MTKEFREICKWVGHAGVWDFSEGQCLYKSPQQPQSPFGICASNVWFSEGTARATIRFAKVDDAVEVSGRLVFGWRSQHEPYLSAGLGGGDCQFCVYQFDPTFGWAGVALTGSRKNLIANHPYNVSVHVQGQRVLLEVDSVQVLEHVLSTALPRGQLGLFAWGRTSVERLYQPKTVLKCTLRIGTFDCPSASSNLSKPSINVSLAEFRGSMLHIKFIRIPFEFAFARAALNRRRIRAAY
jgi:hypothetical protein